MALRWKLTVLGSLLIGGAVAFWIVKIEPMRRHVAWCERTRSAIESLRDRKPANLDEQTWDNWIFWTLNGHGNVLAFDHGIPSEEMDRFESELHQKTQAPIDIGTLEWIWDEFVRLSPYGGKRYSENWRPTSPTRITPFEGDRLTLPPRKKKISE